MKSPILTVVAIGIVPVASLFSLYLLLRGHNEPGGGFVAGLVLSIAIWLQALAFGAQETKRRLEKKIRPILVIGLSLATTSGLFGILNGDPFLTHYHPSLAGFSFSTALVFDVGVYLVVVGSTTILIGAFTEGIE